MAKEITPRQTDYSAWYQDIVLRAGLADYVVLELEDAGLEVGSDPLGHAGGSLPIGLLAQDDELLAAPARHEVHLPGAVAQHVGEHL